MSDAAMSNLEPPASDVTVSVVDNDTTWVPPTGCDFCHKLLHAFRQAFEKLSDRTPSVMLGSAQEVLRADCPHVDWLRSTGCFKGVDDNVPREVQVRIGMYSSVAHLGLWNVAEQRRVPQLPTIFGLVRRPNVSGHPGLRRVVDPEWIDVDLFRLWHQSCDGQHGSRCAKPSWTISLGPAHPDWVVDTVQECIVCFSEATQRYCALSYTWGQTTQLKNTRAVISELVKPGALGNRAHGSQVPETIRNAFAVTRSLGERYIWVDSLCIVQDDAEGLWRQLDQMHLIYANAVVCIVAEVGCDAAEGIRGIEGVSRPRQSHQAVHEIAGGERTTGSRLPFAELVRDAADTDYHQRAWTFQEYMFARRKLIFGRDGVSWLCTAACWREYLHMLPAMDEASAVDYHRLDHERWRRSPVPSLASLTLLVSAFNVKCLTYPEDTMRAFSGIQSSLHGIYEGGLVFGHPELFFDMSLAWRGHGSVTRRRPSSSFAGDRMQDRLPSWSWIGWHGRVQFPPDAELHAQWCDEGWTEPVTQWHAMATPTGPRRAIRSRWHHYKQKAQGAGVFMDGWDQVPFPGEMQTTFPKAMPSRGYSTKLVNTVDAEKMLPFWYPVPLPSQGMPVSRPSEQTQYLSCRTSHAFLSAGPRLIGGFYGLEYCNTLTLRDEDGAVAGVIFAASEGEMVELAARGGHERLELVAIAKGWTVEIEHAQPRDGWPAQDYDREKIDCYFVLWIERREGIAYRRASGRVYARVWDRSREADDVDLVLG